MPTRFSHTGESSRSIRLVANDQLQIALPKYSARQVKEGHAIAELNTLLRPQAKWAAWLFGMAITLQSKLNQRFPYWFSPTPVAMLSKTSVPYVTIRDRFKFWMALIRWLNQRHLAKKKNHPSQKNL